MNDRTQEGPLAKNSGGVGAEPPRHPWGFMLRPPGLGPELSYSVLASEDLVLWRDDDVSAEVLDASTGMYYREWPLAAGDSMGFPGSWIE